ncbi:uncharacterized protein CTRU02_209480 [Colletotrichum truncatum]|uniref:Uncharacterized protein n=1 Tax=Colletotrichum truncatum TaxID=5467 RepID=A0ACC3YSJ8_COLTU|nr:uncharacterized protein CTRU02_08441 [Colletotrichum truncatum]KAF6789742.1 hypothetical protein CTRU02_08441 [Colletotrichum truncatum]
MQFSTFSTLSMLLSLPLATFAQDARCQSDIITDDTVKEYSTAVEFDSTKNKYTASIKPGSIDLTIPSLKITNSGNIKRKYCLASEPSTPRSVSCFVLNATSACTLPDYYGKPFRLDTYPY